MIAKYRPTMPVISVVVPRLKTNQLRWTFTGAFEVCYKFKLIISCLPVKEKLIGVPIKEKLIGTNIKQIY